MSSSVRVFVTLALVLCSLAACGGGGSGGGSDSSTSQNSPPTVSAGTDLTVNSGATVTLAGSAQDSDGAIQSVSWEQISGTEATITNANQLGASFTAPILQQNEVLTFRLSVTDNDGATRSDEINVEVNAAQPPTANAGQDQMAFSEDEVFLSAQVLDPDGSIVSVEWEQTDGVVVGLVNSDSTDARFTSPAVSEAEALTFRITVTDSQGLTAQDSMVITVHPKGSGATPVANAGPDQVSHVGASTGPREVTLSGLLSTDPEGDALYYLWSLVSAPTGSTAQLSDANVATPQFTPDLRGFYEFELVVTDGLTQSVPDRFELIVGKYTCGPDPGYAPYYDCTAAWSEGLHLTEAGGPYYIAGSYVPYGAHLQIDAGTLLVHAPRTSGWLEFGGTATIQGTAESPVRFQKILLRMSSNVAGAEFDATIAHAHFINSCLRNDKMTGGRLILTDSVFDSEWCPPPSFLLREPSMESRIERNVFVYSEKLHIASSAAAVYVQNNLFFSKNGRAGDYAMFHGRGNNLIFIGNSIIAVRDLACVDPAPAPLRIGQCMVSGLDDYSANYWGTTDSQQIPNYIYREDLSVIPVYEPFLNEPDPDTPDVAPYLN